MLRNCYLALALAALLLVGCAPSGGGAAPASGKPSAGGAPSASGGASSSGAPAPAPTAAAQPTVPIKVPAAYSAASGAQLVIMVAEHAGLFREQGLDVDLPLLGGDRAVQTLVANQIAFAALPGSQVVNAAVGGAPVVAVVQEMDTVGLALHGPPSMRDWRDLKGKRLGITVPGALLDLSSRVLIRQAGLQVGDDVALVNAGGVEEIVPAMVVGALDAAVLSVPASLRARDAGFPEIVDMASLGPPARIIHTMLASRRDYLAEQPDAARRFVRAYATAVRRSREDPAAAQAALMKWLKLEDPVIAETTYQAYVRLLKDPPVPNAESWQALLDVMAEVPGINPAVRTTDPQTLIDPRWVSS